jgi:glycine/D-amino acid oxidase-like deaminating enzyme
MRGALDPASRQRAIEALTSGDLDVLVVGGGITGTATALRLAEAGADVVLVERHDLNTQGSGYNAGSLHSQLQHEPFLHKGEAWARAYAPATAFLSD